MVAATNYEALTVETLETRLSGVTALREKVGSQGWSVREVGDGNLNLVFIVEGAKGSAIVKQALPYVRLVGDSWPLPLYRAFYEYHALTRQAERAGECVPKIYHFDEEQALIVMEFLTPHRILRRKLIDGERVEGLGAALGQFCARTAFRGSEFSMKSADKKADVGLFAGNVAIPAITEALVFTDPYQTAEMNHHTEGLDGVVATLRSNVELKIRVQEWFVKFASNAETLVHGDLHSGSVMCTDTDTKVIDPEFTQYGPMAFDLGMLIANFLMAYFSQPGHRDQNDLEGYQEWILSLVATIYETFESEFTHLWNTERTGMLYPASMFEDQGQSSQRALAALLGRIKSESLGICGIEMHRRCLSLAHNADFEDIADAGLRATLEARNLMMGADLILNADKIDISVELLTLAREFNTRNIL